MLVLDVLNVFGGFFHVSPVLGTMCPMYCNVLNAEFYDLQIPCSILLHLLVEICNIGGHDSCICLLMLDLV